eukprot:332371-Rhodomonas_salina.1
MDMCLPQPLYLPTAKRRPPAVGLVLGVGLLVGDTDPAFWNSLPGSKQGRSEKQRNLSTLET